MPLPPLSILYGSATGNAEHIAKDLAGKIPSSGTFYSSVICCEMDQFKKKCQKSWDVQPVECGAVKNPIIAVTSTTGNGDAPENASRFVRYLKRKTTVNLMPFKHCAFSVLALGDTNYDQFCATGLLLDRKMNELGGTRAKKVSLADEGTGLEDVVEPWVETVMECMRIACTPVLEKTVGADLVDSEEEKQKDNLDDEHSLIGDNLNQDKEKDKILYLLPVQSLGVTTLLSIAAANNMLGPLPNPPDSTLPSLTSAMSSCELISKDADTRSRNASLSLAEEHMSQISGSSLSHACQFNMKNPHVAPILAARYLTQTPTIAASNAEDLLLSSSPYDAAKSYVDSFDVANKPKDSKRCIELSVGLPDDFSMEYEPGDSIGILVTNECTSSFSTVISLLTNSFGMNVNTQFVSVDGGDPISAYDAVAKTIDITAVVKKRILASMAHLCKEKEEASSLRLLSSKTPEGEMFYKKFIVENALNFGHVLELFPSCQPTLQDVLGICDGMTPRYYSVSSSPLTKADRLTVAFSVVDYAVNIHTSLIGKLSSRRGGLATQYLEVQCASLLAGSTHTASRTISIFPKPTADFRLPQASSTPLVLIGPGTGVAPFLGFLSHRQQLRREKRDLETQAEQGTWRGDFEIEDDVGEKKDDNMDYSGAKTILFFGCRWPDHDFLFQKELEAFTKNKTLDTLYTAFSRAHTSDNSGEGIRYVQHVMRTVGRDLVDMICNENASVYICGDGNAMGKEVQECIADVLDKHGNCETTGKVYVENMKKKNKLVLDIWS